MNIRLMKHIDSYAGVPICMILDVVSRLLKLFPSRRAAKPPAKILISKFFGIGSVILATPMLNALRQAYPEAKITFFTFASNREIVDRLNLVDEIMVLRTNSILSFAKDLSYALVSIRRHRFDVAIDMEFFAKFSTIITYLSGSPMRVGYYLRQMWRGDLLTHHIYFNHYKHISEVFAALVEPLGVSVSEFKLTAPLVSNEDMKSLADLFGGLGIAGIGRYIVINANASDMAIERRWPAECFVGLAGRLVEETGLVCIFIGGPDDAYYVNNLVSGVADESKCRIFNMAGKTSLGELLALLKRCSLLVTNDSGPLHLAAALAVPTLSFFGPETPLLYGPKDINGHVVFYSALYCSPCLNVFNAKTVQCAGDNICMKSISVEEVVNTMKIKYPELMQRQVLNSVNNKNISNNQG